jgi:hypothetical protein
MAQGFRDFASDTLDAQPAGVTVRSIGTGTAHVKTTTGATSSKALRIAPENGTRYATVLIDAIDALSASNFELQARVKFPAGLDQYWDGAGLIARVGAPIASTGYGANVTFDLATLARGDTNAGMTELTNVSYSTPTDTWLRLLMRVNGSNLRFWWGLDSTWTKTNASTPDLEVTDANITTGTGAGLRLDASNGATKYMEVDWIGYGTDGDAAPTSGGGGGGGTPRISFSRMLQANN